MATTDKKQSPDSGYDDEGRIRVQPREWAAGYAEELTKPYSYRNSTLAPVLGELLLSKRGVTRLQVAEIFAELEGIPEVDRRLFKRVESTRKRLDLIVPGLISQSGNGAAALMAVNQDRLNETRLNAEGEKSARYAARILAGKRVNAIFSAKVYNQCRTMKGQFQLSDREASTLQLILRYAHRGYDPIIIRGVESLDMALVKGLFLKLPEGTIYEQDGRYFAHSEILEALGENIVSYNDRETRIENPNGPYPLAILPPPPEDTPPPAAAEFICIPRKRAEPKRKPLPKKKDELATASSSLTLPIKRLADGYGSAYPHLRGKDFFILVPGDSEYSKKHTSLMVRPQEVLIFVWTSTGRKIHKVEKDALAR